MGIILDEYNNEIKIVNIKKQKRMTDKFYSKKNTLLEFYHIETEDYTNHWFKANNKSYLEERMKRLVAAGIITEDVDYIDSDEEARSEAKRLSDEEEVRRLLI
jgi:hypothetical protein